MATVQVRYIVHDIGAAIPFYTEQLGFTLVMHPAPPFAMLSRGDLRLVLSAPNPLGGGGQSLPDGTEPAPGGWNRFAIEVEDVEATVATLRAAGATFRNDIVTGVGGKQILVEDPSGNPIELFQPTIDEARLEESVFVRIWRFHVRSDKIGEFLAAYGPDGAWARLFRPARGFRGTELLQSADEATYVTIDRWSEAADWETFLDSYREDYAELDQACEGLTALEEDLGAFQLRDV